MGKRQTAQTTWIALLRAVNVGGQGKMPMAELRAVCEELGFGNPATYIQSGNAVFSSGETSAQRIAEQLEGAIAKRFGFTTQVILRSASEWNGVIEHNPLADAAETAPSKLLINFLRDPVDTALEAELQSLAPGGEVLRLRERELYIYFPMGMGQSKLNMNRVGRRLGTVSTTRNWNTLQKLHEMAQRP